MKLTLFYLAILLPIPLMYLVSVNYGPTAFTIFLLVYIFLYRPVIDGLRLVQTGKITKSGFWKMFIPGHTLYYFRDLYFLR